MTVGYAVILLVITIAAGIATKYLTLFIDSQFQKRRDKKADDTITPLELKRFSRIKMYFLVVIPSFILFWIVGALILTFVGDLINFPRDSSTVYVGEQEQYNGPYDEPDPYNGNVNEPVSENDYTDE